MIPTTFNQVTIDLNALRHNYKLMREAVGQAAFLAMVKADGYGHGMTECSKILEEAGCAAFGVAELCEAVLLRQSGITAPIFSMIGFAVSEADSFCQYDITPVVYDVEALAALSQAGVKCGKTIPVHIKVDTGMSRLGVDSAGMERLLELVRDLPALQLAGIASHFPCADDKQSPVTSECLEKFEKMRKQISFGDPVVFHIANSGGALYFPKSRYDMVRCGISLYGYYPEGRDTVTEEGLRPVMSFATRVLQVKNVAAGSGVSYGHTFVTRRPTRLAVLPVGYGDGFSRRLSNCGDVLIRGKRAPVRGRVCMNLCMVDVTDIDGVASGDEAVILGRQGEELISADEMAAKIGTISYEVLCMLGNNNQRKYI